MTEVRHPPAAEGGLAWPSETALPIAPAGILIAAGSNIALDLHGDPAGARLMVFSDGNHHMALGEAIARFAADHPGAGDIFYATTPPRIVIDALETGRLALGNLVLSVRPHVFISPRPIVDGLHRQGRLAPPATFASSQGTAILLRKESTLGIRSVADLLRADVRLALSNPVTEAASFAVYAQAIAAGCAGPQRSAGDIAAYLHSDAVVKSRLIHHREIPELLASGQADASLVYTHLALRYVRVFPEHFDMLPGTGGPVTEYSVAAIGDGGEFGARFVAFMLGAEAGRIYARHGLRPAAKP